MNTVWVTKLPLKDNERLQELVMLGDNVYALSDQNFIFCLNRDKGDYRFSRPFAPPGFTVLGFDLYKGRLISVVGSRLIEIDTLSGRELQSQSLSFGVTCPAVRNSGYFYIAGADGRLRVFRAADRVRLFEVTAENESLITSVVAGDDYVVFATAAGNVICITPDKPQRIWQFDVGDGVVGQMVRDKQQLFLASKDTYIYELSMSGARRPLWKYQTEAILGTGPVVTQDVVYQYVNEKGLTAIDKKSGKFLWQVSKGAALLAQHGANAYVITRQGEFVAMDNKKRRRIYSANFAGVSRYATNLVDSKIYIGDEKGRVACIRPVE
jgi:outer membrane protein assembly factor BamB